jgi:hypothetical protein
MIGIHTCAADPKKIVSASLPLCESCAIDEPQTSILQTSLESYMIIRRRNDSGQPLIDIVCANDEPEVAKVMCPNTLIAVKIHVVNGSDKCLVSSGDMDCAIFYVDR